MADPELPEPADFLEAVQRGLIERGLAPVPTNRAQRRARRAGVGAGEGKHPLGATKPFVSERKAKRRRKR